MFSFRKQLKWYWLLFQGNCNAQQYHNYCNKYFPTQTFPSQSWFLNSFEIIWLKGVNILDIKIYKNLCKMKMKQKNWYVRYCVDNFRSYRWSEQWNKLNNTIIKQVTKLGAHPIFYNNWSSHIDDQVSNMLLKVQADFVKFNDFDDFGTWNLPELGQIWAGSGPELNQ